MKEPLTEKLLLLMADLADYGYRARTVAGALADSGDPRYMPHRRAMLKYLETKEGRKKIKSAYDALKRRNYLQKIIFNGKIAYILSEKGILRAGELKTKYLRKELKKKKLQKGQFLMVFFDVPEIDRKKRDLFRSGLRNLGFEPVQKSVWVSSIDVSKELKALIKDYQLESCAKSLLVKEF